MSVIGIDLGTTSSVVAVIRSGGIDIVVNEVSNRRTPSVVGFTDKLRTIGESGFTARQRNTRNTVSGTKRLLCRKFDDPDLQQELPRMGGCNWVQLPDGSVGAQVNLRNQKQTFSSQQISAMLLAHLKDTCEKYTSTKVANAVVSVPGYYTDAQRRALLDSCKIAGINCLQVINDMSAVALNYGFYRESESIDIKVMFVDVGASDLSVSIAHFTPNQCQILANAYDPHLGGIDIDTVLANHFAERFMHSTHLDIKSNGRAWQRVMDGVERVKKTLNENEQAGLSLECLLEDRDLSDRITRQEYISLLQSSGILDRVRNPIRAALSDAGLQASDLHSVEWVGSGMRAQPLQDAISKAVERTLSSTCNAEESVAKGCSLACALVSPLIRLNKKYRLIDIQQTPVNLTWRTINDPYDTKETSIEVFPRKQQFGKTKYVTLTRKEAKPFELDITYANYNDILMKDVSRGILCNARVPTINKEADETGNRDAEIRLKIKLEPHGITQIVDAELVEKKEVEVEVPVEPAPAAAPAPSAAPAVPSSPGAPGAPPSDADMKDPSTAPPSDAPKEGDATPAAAPAPTPTEPPKPETRKEKRVKTLYTKVPLETKYNELTNNEIEKFNSIELELRKDDNYAIATADAKNKLEATIFSSRDKTDTIWKEFTTDSQSIHDLCNHIEDWLYNEGSDEMKEEYDKKLANLNSLTDPLQRRCFEWEQVPQALSTLQQTLTGLKAEVANGGGEKYAHIPKEDIEKVLKKVEEAEAWLNPLLPQYKNLQKTSDPVFYSSDLIQRNANVLKFCQPILSKPKPAPPKEPAAGTQPAPDAAAAGGAGGSRPTSPPPGQQQSQTPPRQAGSNPTPDPTSPTDKMEVDL
eukprot:TRINITY_DN810_c0_g1_i1.p1 TRINITY_DN810_c0_g1~~TRINITY_DN810_c0_g1_i1.p1  ORF type:complete len:867 (-),score=223.69 TRINITY_DN810_c0_g1_i1:108-2708(-)